MKLFCVKSGDGKFLTFNGYSHSFNKTPKVFFGTKAEAEKYKKSFITYYSGVLSLWEKEDNGFPYDPIKQAKKFKNLLKIGYNVVELVEA